VKLLKEGDRFYPTGSHPRAGQQAEFYIRDRQVYPTGSHPRAGQQAEYIMRSH
jgi:hypothetical protein